MRTSVYVDIHYAKSLCLDSRAAVCLGNISDRLSDWRVAIIARRVDDSMAAWAQSLYATLSSAALATSVLVSGTLYSYVGMQGYRLMAVMCAAGMLLVMASYSTKPDDDSPM